MKQRLIQVKNLCIEETHVEVRVALGFTKIFSTIYLEDSATLLLFNS